MKRISVRTGLLATLVIFGTIIMMGGIAGIYSLRAANLSTRQVHAISARCIVLNNAYMEMQRARAKLARVYAAMRESPGSGIDQKTLASAQSSVGKSIGQFQTFSETPSFEGEDSALHEAILNAAKTHAQAVQRAIDALRENDVAAFLAVNANDVQRSGARYSKVVDDFQKEASAFSQTETDRDNARYEMLVKFVAAGILIALGLVVAAHFALRALVLAPLTKAANLLDEVAGGDLTITISGASNNEVGRLFLAMTRMREGLTQTVRQVLTGSDSVNIGAREIAAGNQDLSSRTEEQSAALEETSASMKELTSTVTRNADNANKARSLAEGAAELATRSGDVVRGVVSTMNDISDSSTRMADIIATIDGIAFQTNILALNAAVEAARAGEQGRGFAVVAGEVQALAQRSASAAREIRTLIHDSRTKVQSGNTLVAEAGAAIDETVEAVRQVADIVQQISTESAEQAASIVQIGQAISQMEEVTQQNAALVEQAAAAAASLKAQANQLEESVSSFRLCSTPELAGASAGCPRLDNQRAVTH